MVVPQFCVSIIILTFILNVQHGTSRFILGGRNAVQISTKEFEYPLHEEEIDIIWRYDHSVHLEFEDFELDGQSGDFLMISDLPLTFDESFEEHNNSDGRPSFLIESIVTSQGLLLSWVIPNDTNIEILSRHGCFIYFHAEWTEDMRGSYPFKGFNINVHNLDEMRIPPSTTTTEATLPEEIEPVYVNKFLSCNPPNEFFGNRTEFKIAVAEVATEYCRETMDCVEYLDSDLTFDDVNIPSDGGIHYCDPLWSVFSTCVEVKFAITREAEGAYLMPKYRLEDMWEKKKEALEARGYCPFQPPVIPSSFNTWVWMASVLGIIIFLLFPLCLIWVWSEQSYKSPGELSPDKLEEKEEQETLTEKRFFDRGNPIYQVIARIKKGSESESKYLGYTSDNGSPSPTGPNGQGPSQDHPLAQTYTAKVTQNVIFQEPSVTFQYDNPGYNNDNESIIYGHGHDLDNSRGRNFDNDLLHDDDGDQRFLRIHRNSDQGGNSDTEI